MRRIGIAIALTILSLVPFGAAQQTASNSSNKTDATSSPAPPPGPIIGGTGTPNFIPIWATTNFLLNSAIYQSGSKVGINNTTPAATLDVYGSINALNYEWQGGTIISAPNSNLFVGLGAGAAGGSNGGSTFVGEQAGYASYGSDNTFIGYEAGGNTTGGPFNTMVGWRAGWFNIDGGENAFFGYMAGYENTASQNSFFGVDAGESNSVGSSNAFFGFDTGYLNTVGSSNTFFGDNAGAQNSSGSGNIFIGMSAGNANTTGSDNIYIANSGPASGNESFAIRIGDPRVQSSAFVAGVYGAAVPNGVAVYVNSNGQLGTLPSSRRFKEQVRDMGDSTDAMMELRPVTFVYKPEYSDGERNLQYGLIAEEVAKIYPGLVAYDTDGQPYSVRYQYLSAMLLNEVQKQCRRAELQAEVIKTQEQKIGDLEQRLLRLEALVGTRANTAQIEPKHARTSAAQ